MVKPTDYDPALNPLSNRNFDDLGKEVWAWFSFHHPDSGKVTEDLTGHERYTFWLNFKAWEGLNALGYTVEEDGYFFLTEANNRYQENDSQRFVLRLQIPAYLARAMPAYVKTMDYYSDGLYNNSLFMNSLASPELDVDRMTHFYSHGFTGTQAIIASVNPHLVDRIEALNKLCPTIESRFWPLIAEMRISIEEIAVLANHGKNIHIRIVKKWLLEGMTAQEAIYYFSNYEFEHLMFTAYNVDELRSIRSNPKVFSRIFKATCSSAGHPTVEQIEEAIEEYGMRNGMNITRIAKRLNIKPSHRGTRFEEILEEMRR